MPLDEEAIFKVACQIGSPQGRADYLRQVCGDEGALHERVALLLQLHEGNPSFLESPAQAFAPAVARTIDMPAEAPIAEKLGTQIGPYKLLQQIGEGGMGVVYMAEQTVPVRRKVALKIIKPGMDTREVIARFEAERQALALMDHPNIAKVFDGGSTSDSPPLRKGGPGGVGAGVPASAGASFGDADSRLKPVLQQPDLHYGRPYFVMELVRGVPITDYCDQNNLPVHERLELFVTVCHAVQHAHQKGIIHRDIKPSNVLVTLHDGRPVPKVIDFGVAKAIGQQLTEKTLFTQFAQMVGTPLYMSPEQAQMTGQDVDTRGDIYSLGVLLYELLTGTTPFERGRMKQAAMEEIRRMIREDEPPSPSTRLSSTAGETQTAVAAHRRVDPRGLSRLVRGDLDWIVMKALEKDRNRRYETANGFAADVVRYMSDEPVQACPPSAVYRFRKFARRNRAAIATATVLASALVLGTAISTWQAIRATRAEQLARDRLQEETKARNDAEAARRAEVEQRTLAEQLEGKAMRQLYDARLAQAKAGSLSRRVGQRFDSLDAVAEAAQIARDRKLPEERSLELRNAAIACLALTDLRLARQWPGWPAGSGSIDFDGTLEQYARVDTQGILSIRRVADDEEIANVPGSDCEYWPVFSRDGKFLAIHSSGKLKVLKLGGPEPAALVQVEDGDHFGIDFSADSRQFAVGHADGSISLYDLASGQLLRRLPPSLPARGHLAFHPGGRQVAVSSGNLVRIRDLETGKVVADLKHPADPYRPAWHPDGKTLAVVCSARIFLWDVAAGEQKLVIEGLRNGGIQLAFNHAGDMLASTGWEGMLRLWDPQTGRQLFSTMSEMAGIPRFTPDDRLLACDLRDGKVGLWEVVAGGEYRTLVRTAATDQGKFFYGGPTIHFGGRLLAVGLHDGAGLWDLSSGRELAFLDLQGETTVVFEPSGALLTNSSCGLFRWPVQFEPATPELLRLGPPTRLSVPGSFHQIACSPDGRVIASPQTDGALVQHSDRPDHPVRLGPHDDVRSVAVSSNGRFVATGSHSVTTVKIWEAESGVLVKELSGEYGVSVLFSPDGKWLLTFGAHSHSGMVRLWTVGSWKESQRFIAYGHAAFSSDGKLLAMETGTGIVRLVDPDTGREYARLEDPSQDRASLTFTPDGTQLVARSYGSPSVHIWDLQKIRDELTRLGLDWNLPPYSPAGRRDRQPLQVHVVSGVASLLQSEELQQRGHNYVRSGQWDEAVGAFTKALELAHDPVDKSRVHLVRGTSYAHFGRFVEALADYAKAVELAPTSSIAANDLAWLLATCPEAKFREPGRAVELAKRAVELAPQDGMHWNTLGVAHFRAGNFHVAIDALQKSMDLRVGGDAFDYFFLALSHWQLGNMDEARSWNDRGLTWIEKNRALLDKEKRYDEELQRFRAEAAELLGVKDEVR